ncbi:MAG: ABC transporter substrate-binding protein, partial [Tissierellia bacterium]|nr:ABC transporter substrate-binding protein [Tissierellia bacterium]
MTKKTVSLIILFLFFILLFGCGNKEVTKEELNIDFCYRDGIPGLTVVKLIKDNPII